MKNGFFYWLVWHIETTICWIFVSWGSLPMKGLRTLYLLHTQFEGLHSVYCCCWWWWLWWYYYEHNFFATKDDTLCRNSSFLINFMDVSWKMGLFGLYDIGFCLSAVFICGDITINTTCFGISLFIFYGWTLSEFVC